MKLRELDDILWTWTIGVVLFIAGFWKDTLFPQTEDFWTYIHELGHALFSFGGKIVGPVCYVNTDWPIGAMGSMLGFHIFAFALAIFSALTYKPLGGFALGLTSFITYEVFLFQNGEFGGDMPEWTPAWYPVTIACTAAVLIVFIVCAKTGKAPWRWGKRKGKYGRNIGWAYRRQTREGVKSMARS